MGWYTRVHRMTSRRNFLEKVKTMELEIFHLSVCLGSCVAGTGAGAAAVAIVRKQNIQLQGALGKRVET